MTFTNIIASLDKNGMDTIEVKAILESYKDAESYDDAMFYQNQLYGFLCGLAALKYIEADAVFEIIDNLESGEI